MIYCSDVVHLEQLTINVIQTNKMNNLLFDFKTPYIKDFKLVQKVLNPPSKNLSNSNHRTVNLK